MWQYDVLNMKKLLLSLVTLVLLVPAGAKTGLSKYVIVYPASVEAVWAFLPDITLR